MIELKDDRLVFRFPDVHEDAELSIEFQRTLRIPDDGKTYPLPPGLGRFPLRHVDDHADKVPAHWLEHGGVMLPMYQSEALWLNFRSPSDYPFAVKISAGKIDAVSGLPFDSTLSQQKQNYLAVPRQPWLDGFCVSEGMIRQFVAMPLGSGYSAEEQITGKAEFGGLQILVYPMKASHWEKIRKPEVLMDLAMPMQACLSATGASRAAPDMGLAPGGRMRQQISKDRFKLEHYDLESSSRCFTHLCNSLVWRSITGANPPTIPPTARDYSKAGLPWFDYYTDEPAVPGSGILAKLKSVLQMAEVKGDNPLPENDSADPVNVIELRKGLRKGQVREGSF